MRILALETSTLIGSVAVLEDERSVGHRQLDPGQRTAQALAPAIASQLEISEHTVKFHLNAVLSKLGAQSRTEAVVRAMRLGLIPL